MSEPGKQLTPEEKVKQGMAEEGSNARLKHYMPSAKELILQDASNLQEASHLRGSGPEALIKCVASIGPEKAKRVALLLLTPEDAGQGVSGTNLGGRYLYSFDKQASVQDERDAEDGKEHAYVGDVFFSRLGDGSTPLPHKTKEAAKQAAKESEGGYCVKVRIVSIGTMTNTEDLRGFRQQHGTRLLVIAKYLPVEGSEDQQGARENVVLPQQEQQEDQGSIPVVPRPPFLPFQMADQAGEEEAGIEFDDADSDRPPFAEELGLEDGDAETAEVLHPLP
uniref:Uncharacterized protein n=1 Tax=Chromera velia CCMP2878 TaxID=1169474 RepID=A0A0K6S764_9ALVE|eukprot:Cvel_18535.t2-p1 / transcript=Cvel_18535.t2 / gene=Cvel_18535 / organism=Chromera_velia_CCMP2878 / gene_product=hypothetical protein / transcript_product=hypothetical protein / location=Cvel_scaffold1542:1597-3974(-) / protein_length=278 / sequence_SO=supercontig / SO=protein_coding / is_pseudo=false